MRFARCVIGGVVSLALISSAGAASDMTPGEQIFRGRVTLPARIWGHERDLPAEASRCMNCHVRSGQTPASGPVTPVGPALSASTLTRTMARRGGPPSSFTEASFCHLLRQGVDPAHIIVPRVMPRYQVTDAQCRDLWHYLVSLTP